jgi:hypothetical protein
MEKKVVIVLQISSREDLHKALIQSLHDWKHRAEGTWSATIKEDVVKID